MAWLMEERNYIINNKYRRAFLEKTKGLDYRFIDGADVHVSR